ARGGLHPDPPRTGLDVPLSGEAAEAAVSAPLELPSEAIGGHPSRVGVPALPDVHDLHLEAARREDGGVAPHRLVVGPAEHAIVAGEALPLPGEAVAL